MAYLGIFLNTIVLAIFSGGFAARAYAAEPLILPNPVQDQAALTIERGISGIYAGDDFLFLFPGSLPHMVKMPINWNGKSRDTRFAKMTDQVKIPLEGAAFPGDWRGAYTSPDRIVVWDASMMQLLVLRSKDFKTVQSVTVPFDRIRPPADRMGEATAKETDRTRKRFIENSRKTFGNKFSGLAEMPFPSKKDAGRNFLVVSRVADFPLLIMSCQKDDLATCSLSRQCFLEGGPKLKAEAVAGVGVVPGTRDIVIGDSERNEVNIYRFNSCFDVVWRGTVRIPARVSHISNMSVDGAGRLWVMTKVPESFTDSNLMYWERDVWYGGK